jgi:copper(I)-binding protein
VIKFRRAALAIFAGMLAMPVSAELMISNAWIREAPPKAKMLAAYFDVHNMGDKTVTIKPGVSADFERIEIHDMSMKNGMMRMKELPSVDVAPGQLVKFQTNGMHLMLVRPSKRLKAGDQAVVALTLGNGEIKELFVPVKRDGGDHIDGHRHHQPKHEHGHQHHH